MFYKIPTRPLPEGAAIITFHFNQQRSKRLRETYYEWLPTLGYPVQCFELVTGDAQPEIADSIVIRGDDRHALWQKERLINLAIKQLPGEVKYVAWLDHDMVFQNPLWLEQSIELIDSGVDAVQPFDQIRYLDRARQTIETKEGSVASLIRGRGPGNCPGAAWVASRDFLNRIGGVYDRNVVGGGDATWFSGITKQRRVFLDRQPPAAQADMQRWLDAIGEAKAGCVTGELKHIWHGDRQNRQYVSRDEILQRHRFDPSKHLIDDSNGLLAWSPDAPQALRDDVIRYFTNRRDDG